MKVLLANKFFFLNGGSETVYFQERDFLKKNGFEVVDFSMQDNRNFPSAYSNYFVNNVEYSSRDSLVSNLKTSLSFIRSGEAVHKLSQLIDRTHPEIAHLHNIYHQLTPSIIPILKKKGIKVILTLHDGKLICPSYTMLNHGKICTICNGDTFYKSVTSQCQDSSKKGVLLAAEAYWHKWWGNYDHVDLFIAPSGFLRNLLAKRKNFGNRVVVLPNGIDTSAYIPDYEDHGYVLYFGRLSKEKGVETLLEAYSSLEIPLKIVGTGPLEDELRMRFPEVEFLGYQTGQSLIEIVKHASLVVVPSEWNENCSMAILEAMALGKPIIASRVGGIPEQIDDQKTGILFDMGNVQNLHEGISSLWRRPSLRQEMGRAARRKLEQEFSLEKHCDKLVELYKSVVMT